MYAHGIGAFGTLAFAGQAKARQSLPDLRGEHLNTVLNFLFKLIPDCGQIFGKWS